jgi:hypothetical protein
MFKRHTAQTWIIVLALTVAAVLALRHIRAASIWYDETITLLTLTGHAVPDWSGNSSQFEGTAGIARILRDLYRFDVHPPLYFWTAAAWRVVAGPSLEALRLLSALFVLASIWLLYRVASDLPIRHPALPALVYAFSGAATQYAYTARAYGMAVFLIILTLYGAQRQKVWTGLAAASCIAVHYFSALCVGPLVIFFCFVDWKDHRRWSLWTACSFLIVAASLTPLVLVHFSARPDQYVAPAFLASGLRAIVTGAFGAAFPGSSVMLLRLAALLCVALCAAGGVLQSLRKGVPIPSIVWAAYITGFFLLALLTHRSVSQMPVGYYLGFSAPFLALLLGFGIDAIPQIQPVLIGLLIFSAATRMSPYVPAGDSRSMIAAIRPACRGCVIVVGAGFGRGFPGSIKYEAGNLPVLVLSDNFASTVKQAQAFPSVYFVPSNEPPTAKLEKEFIQVLRLRPVAGYYAAVP